MRDKKDVGESKIPQAFFSCGKKGMEMWQLVLIILVLFLLLVVIAFYGGLGDHLKK